MSSPLAIVTGASSGIGAAVTSALLEAGWRVVGISRRAASFDSERYSQIVCDLTKSDEISSVTKQIISAHGPVRALVNNAGVGYFAPHEELSSQQIHEMVTLNLLAPMLLTRGLLRSLKETKGHLILISSFSALESSSFGAAYAATKAGLKHLGDSLFDEVRKSGVKVTTITPDITRTPFYDDLSFAPDADPSAAVTPECVAQSVMQVLMQRPGTITTHVVLRPERLLLEKRPQRRGVADKKPCRE
jgi:short-subunit dehydrogenase